MELIFKRAGHLELFRYRDEQRFLFNGVVQSITPGITQNTVDLEDGNSDYPRTYSTNKTGQVTINLNSFQPRLYAALLSAEYELDESYTMRRIEPLTIPETAPYELELQYTPEATSLVVHNEDDEAFDVGDTEPDEGEYILDEKTLTFNAADAGKRIVVAYDTAIPSHYLGLPSKTNLDVFRLTISGEATDANNEGVTKPDSMVFDRVRPSGEIAMPARQNTPQGWSVTFAVQEPRPGYKVVDYAVGR